jgi:uncharacterized protein (TIGR02444 family)
VTIWSFAAEFWGRPGVEAACLELQDQDGQCVALLLWRLWTLETGRNPPPSTLDHAVTVARTWDHSVLGHLRATRRALAPSLAPIEDQAREALRDLVRSAELHAERMLLEALARLPTDSAAPAGAPLESLTWLTNVWGSGASAERLARLADAL